MKRKLSVKNIILAFLISSLIFIVGVSIGNYTSDRKYQGLQSELSDLRMQSMSMDVQYNLLAENPCTLTNGTYLLSELTELASKLDYLENLYSRKDPSILRLKLHYSILQIQHWMFLRKAKEQCNTSYDLILYFYSNENCDDCDTQGVVLTAFRKKYNDEVRVYAFDKDLDDPALRTLVDRYALTETPSIIYNDQVYSGFVSRLMLESIKTNSSEENATENS
jgi:thiol-disulfide isomerase/thioredoxin